MPLVFLVFTQPNSETPAQSKKVIAKKANGRPIKVLLLTLNR